MPYSKDVRCGQGWFETNINCFYDYLDAMDEELIVRREFCESENAYHNKCLEELIEEKVNDYISWKVFGEERSKLDENDSLPSEYPDDVWGYTHDHVCMFIKKRPSWYELRSTEQCEECEGEDTTAWVKVENKVMSFHDACQAEFLKDKPSATLTF